MTPVAAGSLLHYIQHLVAVRTLAHLSDRDLLRRFTEGHDDASFGTIVNRHGPMVWRVCQRVLHNTHEAEDAFQATFLVLARKAASSRWHDSVGNWLYQVAFRVARQAKASTLRRQAHECKVQTKPPADPVAEITLHEAQAVLDEELVRLPDRFRAPLVLCYLENATRDEAARQLGWSLGTLKRRLESGRELLRVRLTRRGLTLSATLLTAALVPSTTHAAIPSALVVSTTKAALAHSAGITAVGVVALEVAKLVEGTMNALWATKLKVVATLLLTIGLLTAGAGLAAQWALTADPPESKRETPPQPPAKEGAAGKPAEDKKARVDCYNDPLPNGAVARLGTIAFRHGRVSFEDSLTFTADGKHLVSTGGGWVRRWDVATGKVTVTLGDGKRVRHMVTADGKRARIGTDEDATEYDLDSGKELQTRRHFDYPKTDAAIWSPKHLSPDGKLLADFNSHGEFTLWSAGAGIVLHHFKPSARPYTAFAFAPDGTTVLVGDDAHTFRVFDLTTAKELRSFGIDNAKAVAGMKISPDGKWLVSVGGKRQENDLNNGVWPDDHFLRLWDLAKGAVVHTIDLAEDHDVRSLLFTPDSGTLITALERNKNGSRDAVRTWDVATGKPGRAWTEGPAMGMIVAVSPDGKTLATLAECGVIRLWDMQTGKEKHPLDATPCPVMDVCWTDAKTIMTIGRDDHALRDWEAATGKPLGSPRALQKPGFLQTFSPDGKLVVAIELNGDSSAIRVHDPANGKLHLEQPGYRAAVSPNGKWAATQCVDEPIRIIDIDTGKRIQTVTLDAEDPNAKYLDSLADLFVFTSDGRSLIVQGKDKISTWDVRTGDQKSAWSMLEKELLKPPVETGRTSWERIEGVAASPDGNSIAFSLLKDGPLDKRGNVTNPFNRIAILEATTGKLLHQIDVDKEFFERVAFSPDGKLLAAGGRRTVRLWDVATGKERGNFEGHPGGFMSIMSLAFSPDGKRLASAGYDSTVLVWDVAK